MSEAVSDTTSAEDEAPEAPRASPKRKRAVLLHPVDRFLRLIDAVERGDKLVDELRLKRTRPTGWTIEIHLTPDEQGVARDSMHYDSQDEAVGSLFRSIMADFGGMLAARARAAEEELLRCRSAIVRSLPPSERQPVSSRKRRTRKSSNGKKAT